MNRGTRVLAASAALVVVGLTGVLTGLQPAAARPADDGIGGGASSGRAALAGDTYQATKTLTRTFTEVDGTVTPVSSSDVTVKVDHTLNLRGRQRVKITWSGAQPSGGRASNPYGEQGLQQEYPVVIMQCRGTDDPSLPLAKQLRPETCWTASVTQRSQVLKSSNESTWTQDVYNTEVDKQRVSGIDPFPAEKCPDADIAPYSTHLTEFVAANKTVYAACKSDQMPPEAAVGAAFPAAEVAAFTDENGNGSVQFELRSDVENESLGCNDKVACSIVVVPIVGISCDQLSNPSTLAERSCRKLGRFAPGSSNFVNEGVDQAVGPSLWWSESNWRNRFSVPVTFGLPPDTCDLLDSRPPTGFYGSELLAQAGLQWAPAYCLNQKRFKFQLNRMSDAAAWTLMQEGSAPAAEVSSEHELTGTDPVGYAPTAVTGFSIGYVIDRPDNAGEYTSLKLNARLIAKLLTQSYLGSSLGRGHPGIEDNPLAIMQDPEFIALNPGLTTNEQEAGATLLSLSESSDVIEQLTEYIANDKDAMAFMRGKADPDGMVINPAYKNLALPTNEWPLLDSYVPETANECRQANPTVYFTSIAAPVTTLRKVSDALLDGWPNVQTRCDYDASTELYKLGRIDRQSYGSRFMLGVVSLGDAARFGLRSAALQTSTDTYVAPSDQTLANAVTLMKQKRALLPFTLDQADVTRAGNAYPGAMVVYTAAKLRNLAQEDADHVAQFVRVSTTEGQRAGSGNGQLPEGYLPIRAKGPTAKLLASANLVADAIEAQTPLVEPTEDPTATPTSEPTDTTTDSVPTDTTTDDEDDLTPPSDDAPSAAAPTVIVPSAYPTLEAEQTAATQTADSSTAGKLFPVLLGVGLIGLLYSLGSRFLVRPPRRKP